MRQVIANRSDGIAARIAHQVKENAFQTIMAHSDNKATNYRMRAWVLAGSLLTKHHRGKIGQHAGVRKRAGSNGGDFQMLRLRLDHAAMLPTVGVHTRNT